MQFMTGLLFQNKLLLTVVKETGNQPFIIFRQGTKGRDKFKLLVSEVYGIVGFFAFSIGVIRGGRFFYTVIERIIIRFRRVIGIRAGGGQIL